MLCQCTEFSGEKKNHDFSCLIFTWQLAPGPLSIFITVAMEVPATTVR